MKITKRGIPPAERKWSGRCSECKTEAEALENELGKIHYDQREGSYACAICPVCGNERMYFYLKEGQR